MIKQTVLLCSVIGLAASAADVQPALGDGYRGIWYMNQPVKTEHRYKYSGGFATYPQQHVPIAIYVPGERKTFFVFGGSAGQVSESKDELLHLVSYYDHRTRTVPRPIILLNKKTEDAHDNPTLQIDAEGYLWVFSSAHGTSRPSYIHRSRKPYDISGWELIQETNYSYPQPWYLPQSRSFFFLHTLYRKSERTLQFKTSSDGRVWTEPQLLAHIEMGNYQVSWRDGLSDRVGAMFDLHPAFGRPGKGLNFRTNLYYVETRDGGRTWKTAQGAPLELPITDSGNPALVHDFRQDDLNVYMKDLAFDQNGRPVLMYLTSKGFEPGKESGPFQWHTARWTGSEWERRAVAESDHNYDHGSLYIESDGTWRIIAPFEPGPQPWGTGGDVVMMTSRDRGATWARKTLTKNSRYNHTYMRKPVNAHPEFYAIWADGSPLEPTPSSLYFCTRKGEVFRLPVQMTGERARPQRVKR
jgi:hypothetical protein